MSAILSLQIVHLLKVCWISVKRTYLRVWWRSTIDLCLMNLPKRSSFKSVLKVYTLSKILLWIKPSYFTSENACYSWCMHQTVNLLRREAWQHHFIMNCDIFDTGQTNILALCYLFGKTWPAHSSPTQATEINTLHQITGKVIDVSRTHIPLKALMIPLRRVKLRGVV